MNIAYGLEGHPENDHFMQIAEEAVSSIEKASIPGTFLVDIIPLLKYVPAWVPGAGFQRQAEVWKTTLDDLVKLPYAALMKDIVTAVISLRVDMLKLINYHSRQPAMQSLLLSLVLWRRWMPLEISKNRKGSYERPQP